MKRKPINPYDVLRNKYYQLRSAVLFPQRRQMWHYDIDSIKRGDTYRLNSLYQRVHAANTLGWDVRLVAHDDGLRVEYVRRPEGPDL